MAEDKSLSDSVTERASAALASASAAVSDTSGKVTDRLSDTRDKLADTTSRLADRLSDTGGTIGAQTQSGLAIVREKPARARARGLGRRPHRGRARAGYGRRTRKRSRRYATRSSSERKRAAGEAVQHGRDIFEETAAAATASASKHGQAFADELQKDFAAGES